jgi:predicted ATP-grasp superfamily ATP-dependent carboligase
VRRVRDPHCFFDWLDRLGVAHPQISWQHPQGHSWLAKRADSAGGWHIQRTEDLPADVWPPLEGQTRDAAYFQREVAGTPMSALFIGDGARAEVIGFNELIVQPVGPHPYVYCGAIGPVYLATEHAWILRRLLHATVAEFRLKGLCSLDFMLDGTRLLVLELNPRPSASMALYSSIPLMRSHVLACRRPSATPAPVHEEGRAPSLVQGSEIIYAPGPLHVSAETAAWLSSQRDVHDLPAKGAAFAEADPVCSVSAHGINSAHVRERLSRRRKAVLDMLARPPETPVRRRPGSSRAADTIA